MDRNQCSEQTYQHLFTQETTPETLPNDPELQQILKRFTYGDIFHQGNLDEKTRVLIVLVVLVTEQMIPQLQSHIKAALQTGLTPSTIKEALYQCAPYIGSPKTINAVASCNQVFEEMNIVLPLSPNGTVTEENRLQDGLAVQKSIFGHTIDKMRADAPDNQKHIQDNLSAYCFGDFYTRGGLDLKTRELLTFCIISALGGCEPQVKGHIQGNINMGNNKETLITALTQCLPYIGFPRTLNALSCINQVLPTD